MNVILALCAGCLFGLFAGYACMRAGLSRNEWIWLQSFYQALKEGQYTEEHDEDGEDDEG